MKELLLSDIAGVIRKFHERKKHVQTTKRKEPPVVEKTNVSNVFFFEKMDPMNPASFNHRTELLATGRTYYFVDQVPQGYNHLKTPTLLCVHGFPDLWYGWRYVIAPWVQKCGWRVVVPTMLGYGGTDKPIGAEHYSIKSLSADLAALLDLIGVHKAVVLGHDWGAATVWRFALWYPDRIRALIALSIPFTPPRPDYLTLEQVVERLPIFGYQLYFNDPSSTKEIENNLPTFISLIYSLPKTGSGKNLTPVGTLRSLVLDEGSPSRVVPILNTTEYQYYLDTLRGGGMNGPLNYYRTTKHNFDEEAAGDLPNSLPASLPVLFLWGDMDSTCSPNQVERMNQLVPSLRVVRILGKGHWLMLQSADVVVDSVSEFIHSVWAKTDESKL